MKIGNVFSVGLHVKNEYDLNNVTCKFNFFFVNVKNAILMP